MRLHKIFVNNISQLIAASDLDKIVDAINEIYLKVDYLFYKETDPEKAAEIMAEILGGKK